MKTIYLTHEEMEEKIREGRTILRQKLHRKTLLEIPTQKTHTRQPIHPPHTIQKTSRNDNET